jgi:chromosomal replication initiation ATPase DnaA
LILSQFNENDRHKAYREQVQRYAKEERRLWEDFRHGLILGTKKYVDKIRRTYLPPSAHDEMPQQKSLAREFNPLIFLAEASKKLKCDLNAMKVAGRVSATDKENRDLLIYMLWRTGTVTNSVIGEQFGITYSSVSHSVKSIRLKLEKDRHLKKKLNSVYSFFKT